jgi:hypothetical protein
MPDFTEPWLIIGLIVALYCLARGIVDLRRRSFIWGALGIAAGALLLSLPIQTHAVKYDLPFPQHG